MPIIDLGELNASFNVRVPVGTIVIWSGSVDNIPKGWHLCNGEDGTPDLRDKFVVGAGNEYQPEDQGGEKEVTLTVDQIPKHTHSFMTHTLGREEVGNYNVPIYQQNVQINNSANTYSTGKDEPHNNLPPYFALCYIMKLTADETDPGVGRSMEGQLVKPTSETEVTAKEGAEIFNDYRERTFNDSGKPAAGNVASGIYSHAEGIRTTASGGYSHAEGIQTIASGARSHAEGNNTTASGSDSHAEGIQTIASGARSHAEGNNTTASGSDSHAEGATTIASNAACHAEGTRTTASGIYSHAEGSGTTASGTYSHAEGSDTKAHGNYSHAEGLNTTASGIISHAEGSNTTASGSYSHAGCLYTIAHYGETAIGHYNVDSGLSDTSKPTVPNHFIVGKGTGDARANAFRVANDGVYGTAAFKNSGADYAEMFEWEDGNPNKEDRVGRFVTLHGDKIRLATSDDNFILGVVSGNPSIVGDDHEDMWQGMYVRDVFGRHIFEEVSVPDEVDSEGNVIVPAHTERREKINPNYDQTTKYIGRQNRPEWSAVGMLGKLVLVDDGSCEVDGWCKPGVDGIATKSQEQTKYRVISRLDDTHIKILII